jgi:CDP-diacylglycerol--glycerol-3-phosphate 3-phosphatidyltransferase
MISRDIIIDGYRINAAKKNIIIPANIWGKLKTLSQMLGIIVLFFLFNSTPNVGWNKSICYYTFQNFLLYVALVLSMTSGIIYVKKINKMNHGKRK